MRLTENERDIMLIAIGGALASTEVRDMFELKIKPEHIVGADDLHYLVAAIQARNKEAIYNILKGFGVEESSDTVIESILNKLRDLIFRGECELSTSLLKNTAQYNPEQFLSTLDSIRERMATYVNEEDGN